jgi:hypothetical protein
LPSLRSNKDCSAAARLDDMLLLLTTVGGIEWARPAAATYYEAV